MLEQHRRRGNAGQAVAGNAAEHHPQTEVIDQLTGVDKVEAQLLLQDAVDEVADAVAVVRHGEVAGQADRQRHRHIAGTGRPRQTQAGAARLVRGRKRRQGGRRQAVGGGPALGRGGGAGRGRGACRGAGAGNGGGFSR
ncbi:MAG: hypothetical protein ACK55I_32925, partial [bacterium]